MTTSHQSCCGTRFDFSGQYECAKLPEILALERQVLGCDYGGTSWTTKRQADQIAASLQLTSNSRVLEIGSGSGWPGLFLAHTVGCAVTLLDIPLNALHMAHQRAVNDGITDRVNIVCGSGAYLPVQPKTFDRLSHSDVLCCLPEKIEMLRECRRAATDNAKMHFSVIHPAPGLSPSDHEKVLSAGPPFIDVPDHYENLLQLTGWHLLHVIDVSAEFENSLETLVEALKSNQSKFQAAYGIRELEEEIQRREIQIETVKHGMMKRRIFICAT